MDHNNMERKRLTTSNRLFQNALKAIQQPQEKPKDRLIKSDVSDKVSNVQKKKRRALPSTSGSTFSSMMSTHLAVSAKEEESIVSPNHFVMSSEDCTKRQQIVDSRKDCSSENKLLVIANALENVTLDDNEYSLPIRAVQQSPSFLLQNTSDLGNSLCSSPNLIEESSTDYFPLIRKSVDYSQPLPSHSFDYNPPSTSHLFRYSPPLTSHTVDYSLPLRSHPIDYSPLFPNCPFDYSQRLPDHLVDYSQPLPDHHSDYNQSLPGHHIDYSLPLTRKNTLSSNYLPDAGYDLEYRSSPSSGYLSSPYDSDSSDSKITDPFELKVSMSYYHQVQSLRKVNPPHSEYSPGVSATETAGSPREMDDGKHFKPLSNPSSINSSRKSFQASIEIRGPVIPRPESRRSSSSDSENTSSIRDESNLIESANDGSRSGSPSSCESPPYDESSCTSCEAKEIWHRAEDERLSRGRSSYGIQTTSWSSRFSDLMTLESESGFIDSHCHIDFLFNRRKFMGTFSEYQLKHQDTFPKSYRGCIAIFCKPLTFCKKYMWKKILDEKNVWGAFGCHPKSADQYGDRIEVDLRIALTHPKVRALGEIGLDYSGRNTCSKEIQHEVFRRQLKIAVQEKLSLVIHIREANKDCMKIMKELVPKNYKIHLHCFMDDWNTAKEWLEYFPNLCIGLTNVVTFMSATEARDVAKHIPLDRLLLETDAPYFVPRNCPKKIEESHPGMAIFVAAKVADLRRISIEEVLCQTRKNTRKVYGV